MIKRLIIFLIRKRLRLKKYEYFRFNNQKKSDVYYFTKTDLSKIEDGAIFPSNVSLNWLLNDHCKVVKIYSEWRKEM